MNYSVLISVYKNDKPEFFREAIRSILCQTVPPSEIVLVRDGGVPEPLQEEIDAFLSGYPDIFTYLPLEENGGLGNALRLGIELCKNDLVGRMDADDISLPDRFERQLAYFELHPETDILSGNISEFMGEPENIVSYRNVPKTHEEIVREMGNRSPFNHPAVMFRRDAVLRAGSYESFYLFEDWYLWVKLYLSGATLANLDTVLLNMRISGMAKRRGGWKYYKSCVRLLRFMKKNGVIGTGRYIKTCAVRFVGYVLLPNGLREWAYKKFLRKDGGAASVPEKVTEEV